MATNANGTRTRPATAPCDQARPNRACFIRLFGSVLCIGMLVLVLVPFPQYAVAGENTPYPRRASGPLSGPRGEPAQSAATARAAGSRQRADFGRERASPDARHIADWIVDSADNQGLPFVIVDKIDARIFVFDAGGRIRGAAPALLGFARGDDTIPGIGEREYADMSPETRTTPAGRFVAAVGANTRGEDVLWVDYEAAVDIHRVVTAKPKERRLERLATPTPLDNRISYGCINVPQRFYESVVRPVFAATHGIVYVLPETRPAREVFGSYDIEDRSGPTGAGPKQAPR